MTRRNAVPPNSITETGVVLARAILAQGLPMQTITIA